MNKMSSDLLNPARMPKIAKALKAERNVHRITFNPSSANPGETLYVTLPKLGNYMVFVPFSTFLRFDLEVAKSEKENSFVQNVSRNLVSQFKVILGSNTIKDTDRYDLFEGFHDMLTTEEDIMMGIQETDYRKLRADSHTKSSDAKKIMHCAAYGSKFSIPLTHPILDGHGAFYQKALKDDLKLEVQLAGSDMIAITSNATKDYNYALTNIQLEYTTILSPELSSSAMDLYSTGRTFFFEDVHLFKTIPGINIQTQKTLAIQNNDSRRCMKGAFLIFTKNFTVGTRDTEEFINSKITSVITTIDGVPHKLFSDGILSTDLWQSILNRIGDHFKEKDFHNDKFAFWVDLRASPDNLLHGDGEVVGKTNDGVRLDITWAGRASTVVTCYVFLVSDAAIFVRHGRLQDFKLK